MSKRVVAVAIFGCLVGALPACSSGSRESLPTPSVDIALQNIPSDYGAIAVLHYNDALAHHHGPPYFAAVRSEGKTWTGDPHFYERLCGARITNANGTVVDVLDAGVYLDLTEDPRQWATYNAWLQDPAIYGYFAQVDLRVLQDFTEGRAVGSTAACPAFHSVAPPPIPSH